MYQFIRASAHATGLPEKSVHMVITSPPYWGLRKYAGDQGIMWDAVSYAPMAGLPQITIPAMQCGLGEEPSPEAYIGHLILVMREMWRVLRADGTAWVNLASSYAGETTKPDLYSLRDDLTEEETRYVLSELAKIQNVSASQSD